MQSLSARGISLSPARSAPVSRKKRVVVVRAAAGHASIRASPAAVATAAASAVLLMSTPADAAHGMTSALIQPSQAIVAKTKEAQGTINVQRVKLAYELSDLEPFIDATTMNFHYNAHYAAYVNNTQAAVNTASSSGTKLSANTTNLTGLIKSVNSLGAPLQTAIRNQGGGAWNHALYFRHLAPASSDDAQTQAISPELTRAIQASFGGVDSMKDELRKAATGLFGSGWAWLCVSDGPPGQLVVTTTANQDNPLMGDLPSAPPGKCSGCTPVLGVDVWEHAYYVKHGPKRAAYLDAFWNVVNWHQVSQNYANAVAGNIAALVE